jgi:hypothetical protein
MQNIHGICKTHFVHDRRPAVFIERPHTFVNLKRLERFSLLWRLHIAKGWKWLLHSQFFLSKWPVIWIIYRAYMMKCSPLYHVKVYSFHWNILDLRNLKRRIYYFSVNSVICQKDMTCPQVALWKRGLLDMKPSMNYLQRPIKETVHVVKDLESQQYLCCTFIRFGGNETSEI